MNDGVMKKKALCDVNIRLLIYEPVTYYQLLIRFSYFPEIRCRSSLFAEQT
jgi:hypothetical protein